MFLVVASILIIGGFIYFQANRIGKLQARNAMLLELAEAAMAQAALYEGKFNVAQDRIDGMLGFKREDYEEDSRKKQAYAKLLSL